MNGTIVDDFSRRPELASSHHEQQQQQPIQVGLKKFHMKFQIIPSSFTEIHENGLIFDLVFWSLANSLAAIIRTHDLTATVNRTSYLCITQIVSVLIWIKLSWTEVNLTHRSTAQCISLVHLSCSMSV